MARILLVDDTAANRALALKLLAAAGHDVQVAENGLSAVSDAQRLHPDLVLLDLALPGIDGWEALRRLRGSPETAALRIVALTAHAMVGDRERAMRAGFDGYLSKPIEVATFAESISVFLR